MTEEELNKLEAMARPIEGATSSMLIPGYYVLELVRLARVGLAVTPRPISEAASGIDVIVFYDDESVEYIEADDNDYEFKPYEGPAERGIARPTHFIPLSALPKPGSTP